jgi:hypothetical protein
MAASNSGNINTSAPPAPAPAVGNNPFQSASLYVGDLANDISEVCISDIIIVLTHFSPLVTVGIII